MTAEDARPTVYVFYDYACPYAYIGNARADRLEREFDVRVAHVPWEIYPETAAAGEPLTKSISPWVQRLADEVELPIVKPDLAVNTNLALRGAEYAKDQGEDVFRKYHASVFDALWARGENVGDVTVLKRLATEAGMDADAFADAIRHHAYQARLDASDRAGERLGVQRVPTFVFGDQRIVGNDPFEDSLRKPLAAFLERWKTVGVDRATTLEEDTGLEVLL